MAKRNDSRSAVNFALKAVEDKKGIDPVVLDVRKVTDIADYFLIVHGTSDRHVRTIADGIVDVLSGHGIDPNHVEGLTNGKWVLIDYSDIIVHVFYHETRKYYNLERLWGEAKTVKGVKKHEK